MSLHFVNRSVINLPSTSLDGRELPQLRADAPVVSLAMEFAIAEDLTTDR